MKRQTLLIAVVVLLLLAILVWLFFTVFERRVEEHETGFQGEARQNEYLAAERFLQKYGMQIKSLSTILDLKAMPPSDDVLFIPTARYDLSPEKIQEILSWVKHGGHLITRSRRPFSGKIVKDDTLFDLLGVETHAKKEIDLLDTTKPSVIDVHVNSKIEDKKVEFDMNVWMKDLEKHDISWRVKGENGSQLLEYQIGEGFVTLLSDIGFLKNSRIAKHDHAAFLYTLVHVDNRNRNIWIVRNDDMPSLLSVLRQKAAASLIALAIFLVFWLWYVTRRFGPLQQTEEGLRRSLREHITSTGFFQWRCHNRSTLFLNAKLALQEQIAQSRPLWTKLGEAELAAKLAKIAGVPTEKILAVLQAGKADKENEFTQYIEILSQIRKKL
jgi:hypothetical protein